MIKTIEVIENDDETLEEKIEKAIIENKITRENLIDIKYHKSKIVEPCYDDDHHYLIKDGHEVSTTTSALIIWEQHSNGSEKHE